MDHTDGNSQKLGLSADELSAFADAAGLDNVDHASLLTFALSIAEECAEIGDRYSVGDRNCGNEIRARFGLG